MAISYSLLVMAGFLQIFFYFCVLVFDWTFYNKTQYTTLSKNLKYTAMRKNVFVTTLLAVLLLASQSLFAQSAGQTPQPEKRLSYNMINEYGFFLGGNIGFNGIFVNSLKFNRTNDLLGIGVGYSIDIDNGQGVPLFLNYRHYFDRPRALKPLINIAAGTTFNFWNYYDWDDGIYYDEINDEYYHGGPIPVKGHGFGLYATIASGFKVKAFSFTAGFFIRTSPRYNNDINGGIDVKVGYTF